MEHLKFAALMETTDELEWITHLLLVNQSYNMLHHHQFLMRKSFGKEEKFNKLKKLFEQQRLEMLDGLVTIKKTAYSEALRKEATATPGGNPEGQSGQPVAKKRGRKPKAKFPSLQSFIEDELT